MMRKAKVEFHYAADERNPVRYRAGADVPVHSDHVAGLVAAGKIEPLPGELLQVQRDGDAAVVRVGDLVQWSPGGVDQFTAPVAVTGLSDDGSFVFVDGSNTGLPAAEVTPVPTKRGRRRK